MRYITDTDGYVKEVSFGADIACAGDTCTEYTGSVPEGYTSLEAWYLVETEKLYRWKIVDGELTLDAAAVAPVELSPIFMLIDSTNEDYPDYTNNWRWVKYKDGTFKAEYKVETSTGALSESSVIDGLMTAAYETTLPFEAVIVDMPKWGVTRTANSGGIYWACNRYTATDNAIAANIYRAIVSTGSFDITIGCTVTGLWDGESSGDTQT